MVVARASGARAYGDRCGRRHDRPGGSRRRGGSVGWSRFGDSDPPTQTAEAQPPATEPLSAETGAGGAGAENRIRIIANRRNNALLIYATPSEYAVIEGMLRKIDIIPLQVLIEATIAEVDLNDQLQYGTQFFFKIDHVAETLGPPGSRPFLPGDYFRRLPYSR